MSPLSSRTDEVGRTLERHCLGAYLDMGTLTLTRWTWHVVLSTRRRPNGRLFQQNPVRHRGYIFPRFLQSYCHSSRLGSLSSVHAALTHRCRALNTIHEALTIAVVCFSSCTAVGTTVNVSPHSLQMHYCWPGESIFICGSNSTSCHFQNHLPVH